MQDEIPEELPGEPSGDAVGHGRPPRHSRFRPGRSGNPTGRPKGSRNLATLLQAELRRPVTVTEGGRTRRVQKAAAMVASQVNKALKGDTRAFNTVLQATGPRAGSWQDADAAGDGEAELAAAHDQLHERLERLVRESDSARDRLAVELAEAGVAEEHLDLLFGPRGDRLREALTAALREVQARGVDIREVAEHALLAEVAGDCAEALLAETPGG